MFGNSQVCRLEVTLTRGESSRKVGTVLWDMFMVVEHELAVTIWIPVE